MKPQNRKFVIYTTKLDFKSGGLIVLHNLAKDLIEQGCAVKLYVAGGERYKNDFCNDFATLEDVDASTVVIYPEIVEGNPLQAKHVVRWILCDIGVHCSKDIYKTWGKGDLVFHFSTFNNKYDPHSIDNLYTIWIDPAVKNKNLQRSGSCYLFKKASAFHKDITLIHPKDALMIDYCSNEEIIDIFNKKEYFYCYDPYAFYDVMAALCGCIPVVSPMVGLSKLDWLKTRVNFQVYLGKKDNIAGIAYGMEDIPYARDTLHHVEREQKEVVEYGKKTVIDFIHKVDAYFFSKKGSYAFKTVESFTHLLGSNPSRDKTNEEIEHLQLALRQKNQEVAHLSQEITNMRSSKFWKMRNLYRGIFRFGP